MPANFQGRKMLTSVSQNATFTALSSKDSNKNIKQAQIKAQDASQDKINKITKDIENGDYKIDLGALAAKIADELI